MQLYTSEEVIIENLQDAGCNKETISAFVEKLEKGEIKAGICTLEAHRRVLLDDLHKNQKQIDCLDYLVYQIQKHAE